MIKGESFDEEELGWEKIAILEYEILRQKLQQAEEEREQLQKTAELQTQELKKL